MKLIVRTAILFVALILQVSVISQMDIMNVIPDFFLVVLLYTVSVSSMKYSIAVGAVFGALLDLITGKVFGIHTGLCLLFSIAVCFVSNGIRAKKMPYYLLAALIFTAIYEYVVSLFLMSGTPNVTLRWAFLHKVLPTALYNTVWMLPVYLLFHRYLKRFFYEERKELQ